MAWLSSTWRRRVPISAVTDSTASTRDVTVSIPAGWDEFWDAIDASGHGVRVTEADGVTPIVYDWSGFNKTNKTGTIQLESAPTPSAANRCVLYWMYYYPTSTASNGSGSVTVTSGLTAYIDLGRPGQEVVQVGRQRAGATTPEDRVAKPEDASTFVWLDFSRVLQKARSPYNGRMSWEEAAVANVAVLDDGGTPAAGLTDDTEMRWISAVSGSVERVYLRLRLKAGTSGEKYTLVGEFYTATPDDSPYRVIQERVGVSVYDQLEA